MDFNGTAYLDANFLIAYSGKNIKQPLIHKRAKILFAKLLAEKKQIMVSPLVFDEAWFGIRKEVAPKKTLNKNRLFISALLNKIGLRLLNEGIINFACFEIIDRLRSFNNFLLSLENFKVVQFNNPRDGIKRALDNIKKYKLQPRDAFHLAYMQDNNVNDFITRDKKDFSNKELSLNIINF